MSDKQKIATLCWVNDVGVNDVDGAVRRYDRIVEDNGNIKFKLAWCCPFYARWAEILRRCYSPKFLANNPTYVGCEVSDEWKYFSNFKKWMMDQDWEGMHLDKDILSAGNKVYSADTCAFITQSVNNFMCNAKAIRGDYPIGVFLSSEGRYQAKITYNNRAENLGIYDCPYEAHQVWLTRKLEIAREIAATQSDERVAKAIVERYENYDPHSD